jgi:hypothetical protein
LEQCRTLDYCRHVQIGDLIPVQRPPQEALIAGFVVTDRRFAPPFGRTLVRGMLAPEADVLAPQALLSVEMEFAALDEDGRPRPIKRIAVEPRVELEARDIRNLPWARLIRAGEALVMAQHHDTRDAWRNYTAAVTKVADPGEERRYRKRGRPRLGYAHLNAISERYQQLCKGGEHAPGLRIADEYTVNPSTARSWIRQARQQGFLPPARRGQAG